MVGRTFIQDISNYLLTFHLLALILIPVLHDGAYLRLHSNLLRFLQPVPLSPTLWSETDGYFWRWRSAIAGPYVADDPQQLM